MSYTYDNVGNVLSKRDNRGITTGYGYDALNRLRATTYNDGITQPVSFSYDGCSGCSNTIGRLTQISNGWAIENYTAYDAIGNVTASNEQTANQTYPFSYTYNLAGALTSETYPSGRLLKTDYDGANRPSKLTGNPYGTPTNYVTSTAYWPHGAAWVTWYGSGLTAIAGFNAQLQPNALWATPNAAYNPILFGETPNWNSNGTLQSATTYAGGPSSPLTSFNASFLYDGVNRLSWAGDAGWARSFGYDPYGNMWVTGWAGIQPAGNAPTSNIFNASTNQINGFGYDAAGNLQSINGNSAAYNAENEAVSVTEAPAFGGGTETLIYDGLGQRVQKILPGGTTAYVYDAFGQLAAEYSTVPNTPQCTTCYLSYDHLGSVRLVTDAANNVIARHDYLPFGEEIPGGYAGRGAQWGAPDGLTQRFTGQVRDSETGQDYFNARYFTGALGRFNSPDPFPGNMDLTNPQTFNRYAYALNNPLAFIDPFGLDACEDEDNGDDSSSCSNTPDSSGTYHCTVFLSCGDLPPIAQQSPPDQIIDIPSTPNTGIDSGEPDPSTYEVPLDDLGAGVINLLGQNAAAQQRFIGKFAATSVATGASIALAPMLGSALNRLAVGPGTGRLFYSGWSTVESTLARVTPGLGRILPQSPMGSWYMRTFGPGGAGQPLVNLGWRGLSWGWAAGAAGTVKAFTPGVVNSASYWVTTEFPTLMRNPNVFTPIVYPWLLP